LGEVIVGTTGASSWPPPTTYDVRELANVIERAVVLGQGPRPKAWSPRSFTQDRCGAIGVPIRTHFVSRRHGCLSETVGHERAGRDSGKSRRRGKSAWIARKISFTAS